MINEILGFTHAVLMPQPDPSSGVRKFKGSQAKLPSPALTVLTRMSQSANNQI
jgi:hypothetical protein